MKGDVLFALYLGLNMSMKKWLFLNYSEQTVPARVDTISQQLESMDR